MANEMNKFSEDILTISQNLINSGLTENPEQNEKEAWRLSQMKKNILFIKSLFTQGEDQDYESYRNEQVAFFDYLADKHGINVGRDPGNPASNGPFQDAKMRQLVANLANNNTDMLGRIAPEAMARVDAKIQDYADPNSENSVAKDIKAAGINFTDDQFIQYATSLAISKSFHEEFPPKNDSTFVSVLKKSANSINAALQDPNKRLGLSAAKFAILAIGTGGASMAVGSVFLGVEMLSNPSVQNTMKQAVNRLDDYFAAKGINTAPVKRAAASIGARFEKLKPNKDKPMSMGAKVALGIAGVAGATAAVAFGMDAVSIDFVKPENTGFTRSTGGIGETLMQSKAETVAASAESLATDQKVTPSPAANGASTAPVAPATTTPAAPAAPSAAPAATPATTASGVATGASTASAEEAAKKAFEATVGDIESGNEFDAIDEATQYTTVKLPEGGSIWRAVAEHIQNTTGMAPQTADIVNLTNQIIVDQGITDATKLQPGYEIKLPLDMDQVLYGDKVDAAKLENINKVSNTPVVPGVEAATKTPPAGSILSKEQEEIIKKHLQNSINAAGSRPRPDVPGLTMA